MKIMTLLAALLGLSSVATAHVEPGFYFGRTPNGQTCFMQAVSQYYENNFPHPLNERVVIRIGTDEFKVGHPAVIDAQQSAASFNHDIFQGVLATKTGARALILEMNHDGPKEGPRAFQLIDHRWQNNQRQSLICRDLVLKTRK